MEIPKFGTSIVSVLLSHDGRSESRRSRPVSSDSTSERAKRHLARIFLRMVAMSPRSKRASSREVRFTAGVKTRVVVPTTRSVDRLPHVSLSLMRATLRHLSMQLDEEVGVAHRTRAPRAPILDEVREQTRLAGVPLLDRERAVAPVRRSPSHLRHHASHLFVDLRVRHHWGSKSTSGGSQVRTPPARTRDRASSRARADTDSHRPPGMPPSRRCAPRALSEGHPDLPSSSGRPAVGGMECNAYGGIQSAQNRLRRRGHDLEDAHDALITGRPWDAREPPRSSPRTAGTAARDASSRGR